MDYLDRIKKIKSEKKITNDALSEKTGIPLGTLSKILAGISDSPKFANIMAICEALECSVSYIVTGEAENNNNYYLNDDEMDFIELYRGLDPHSKELLRMVAQKESERVETGSSAVLSFPTSQREAFAPTASDLRGSAAVARPKNIGSSKYASYTGQNSVPLKRRILLYDLPVSAGCGVFLDDDAATEITIPDTAKSSDADFALKISGDSMEPKYRNGDHLLVRATDSIEIGEIGVFVLDGEGFVKVYGGDRLISLNSAYSPILLKEFTQVRCVGVVTGKLKKK